MKNRCESTGFLRSAGVGEADNPQILTARTKTSINLTDFLKIMIAFFLEMCYTDKTNIMP